VARQTALKLFRDLAQKAGHAEVEWQMEGIAETAGGEQQRSCAANFVTGGESYAGTYDITWQDKKAGTFYLSLKVASPKGPK